MRSRGCCQGTDFSTLPSADSECLVTSSQARWSSSRLGTVIKEEPLGLSTPMVSPLRPNETCDSETVFFFFLFFDHFAGFTKKKKLTGHSPVDPCISLNAQHIFQRHLSGVCVPPCLSLARVGGQYKLWYTFPPDWRDRHACACDRRTAGAAPVCFEASFYGLPV